MTLDAVVVRRARLADIDGILKLAEANEVEHGGALLGHLHRSVLIATLERLPSIVATKNGQVVGFLVTWEKTESSFNTPIVKTMLQTYPGGEDAYVYGPVCVDAAMRGHGLAEAMFMELRRLLPGREGILFIKVDNEPSLRAHRKMGMQKVAEFTYEGTEFIVLAYRN